MVEAIAEDLAIKTTLFENLDEICKPGAILATTTSSLPIIACARATSRPQDVIGMHFFNPAPIMKLVEIVSTVSTDDAVTETTQALVAKLGKVGVSCSDRAGFIVNALLFPYLNDAVRMLEAHYATADDIDTAMKQGCALPMGPFELLDVVGNDVSLAIQREALPGVPRARLRSRASARAPGDRRLPRSARQSAPGLFRALSRHRPGGPHQARRSNGPSRIVVSMPMSTSPSPAGTSVMRAGNSTGTWPEAS